MEGASRLWADSGADREAVVLFAKFHSCAVLALAAASLTSGSASGFAAPDTGLVIAQEQTEPAAQTPATADTPAESGETAAPAATQETPAETSETPAQPSDADGAAKPDDGASQAAPAADDSADVAPAATEAPAATTAEPSAPASSDAQASSIDASQLKIGTAVFGSDGQKIGEVNGVKSDTDGKVQEILVTDGVAAGLNAKVFAVPGNKITGVADGVKLSLSSEEAKQLPVIDNGNG
jgi:sporulation protein YlmC with PRC-barrel domain